MKKLILLLLLIPLVSFGQDVMVIRIIDGDTFEIENGDKVRMIGIDAPELKDEWRNRIKKLSKTLNRKQICFINKR